MQVDLETLYCVVAGTLLSTTSGCGSIAASASAGVCGVAAASAGASASALRLAGFESSTAVSSAGFNRLGAAKKVNYALNTQ
jgi:hypothetical protein